MKGFVLYCKKYGKAYHKEANKIKETKSHLDITKFIPRGMVVFERIIFP